MKQILIIFIAAISGILYGYDLGIINAALLFINKDIAMSISQESFLVGSVLGGGAFSTLFSGPLSDKFGRKPMLIAAAVIFIISILAIYDAHSYQALFIGRLGQGLAVGIVTIVTPLYLAEVLSSRLRGRGIATFQLMLTFGILAAASIGSFYTPTENWRAMFLSALIPGTILLLGMLFLPDSPRWMLMKNKITKAKQTLSRLFPAQEVDDILRSHQESQNQTISFFEALKLPKYFKPFLIVVAIAILQQLLGITVLLQYSSVILKDSGIGSNIFSAFGANSITAVNFVVTIIGLLLVDKLGRKKLLIFGTSLVTLALVLCATAEGMLGYGFTKGITLCAGFSLLVLGYAVGPGVVVWLAISELLPQPIRSSGMSIALFLNSLTSAAFGSVYLIVAKDWGFPAIFLFSAIAGLLYSMIAWRLFPETKGKTLEQIEEHFS